MEWTLLICITQDIRMIVRLLGLVISSADEIYNAEKISILLNFFSDMVLGYHFFITKTNLIEMQKCNSI
jgi:hypothetical protein